MGRRGDFRPPPTGNRCGHYFFLYLPMPIALLGGIFVASSPIPRLCHQLWLPPYSAYCVSVLYTRGYTRHLWGQRLPPVPKAPNMLFS